MNKKINKKYLIFSLGSEKFAVNVKYVVTLVKSPVITKAPKMPEYIDGVIDFMEKAVPVFDTKKKLLMDDDSYSDSQLITIIEIENDGKQLLMGLKMDDVHDVINIDDDQIENNTSMGENIKNDYIDGYADFQGEFVILLNINAVVLDKKIITEV